MVAKKQTTRKATSGKTPLQRITSAPTIQQLYATVQADREALATAAQNFLTANANLNAAQQNYAIAETAFINAQNQLAIDSTALFGALVAAVAGNQ